MNTSPLILGFDTSGAWCAAALCRGETLLEQIGEPMARGQAEALVPMLEDLLSRHGTAWNDLDALGVGIGPGNFTGIRIGVSAARGLALGLDVPAYGVDGFSQRKVLRNGAAPICIPAPRDSFYVDQPGGPALLTRDELVDRFGTVPDESEPADLAGAITQEALSLWPNPAPAPAPLYLRAPDAAPASDTAPTILT